MSLTDDFRHLSHRRLRKTRQPRAVDRRVHRKLRIKSVGPRSSACHRLRLRANAETLEGHAKFWEHRHLPQGSTSTWLAQFGCGTGPAC